MKLEQINIFTRDHGFMTGDLEFDSVITSVKLTGPEDPSKEYCIPGLIDIHTHGCGGEDFSDASPEGLRKMGEYYARHGVTSFAGTAVTLPVAQLEKACRCGADYACRYEGGAKLLGIRLEGPHFSFARRGAQNPAYLLPPDTNVFEHLFRVSRGLLKITDIAPELPGAMEYIQEAAGRCRVSVAHTEADYNTASRAFSSGASLLTHSFNAMAPIQGREPGPVVAALEQGHVYAELISDGKHVAPANVRMMFRLFGADRIVLISDSLRCCGMPEGNYTLGGQEITVKDGLGYLSDGTIAGAANNLFENLKAAVSFGVRREDAITAATANPAAVLSCDGRTGSLEEGKDADIVIYRNDFELQNVYISGRQWGRT